jgi:hypothetical protein
MDIFQIDRNKSYRLSAGIGGFDDWEVVRLRTQCTKGSGTLRLRLSCEFPLSIYGTSLSAPAGVQLPPLLSRRASGSQPKFQSGYFSVFKKIPTIMGQRDQSIFV